MASDSPLPKELKKKELLDFLHSPAPRRKQYFGKYVRSDVFTAVSMKNAVFLDVTTCGSCRNRLFVET
jgi:hypothetical protein